MGKIEIKLQIKNAYLYRLIEKLNTLQILGIVQY